MTSRRHLGFVAAAATLLAATPLSGIFAQWTWMIYAAFAVGIIEATATGVRAMRGRIAAQGLGMMAALLLVLTLMFSNGHCLLGIIPTPDTVAYFGKLLNDAGAQIRDNGVPVPDLDGLLFLTTFGIGLVAILTDLFTVALRRPALAGLPMLGIYAVPVAVYPDSVSVVPFIFGAAAYLWLLISDNVDRVRRFGRRFTGEGRDVDVWETSPLSSAGRRLAIVGVLVAILLPLLIPQMSSSFFDQFGGEGGSGTGGGKRTGGSANIDLFANLEDQLKQSATKELVRVTTDDPNPYYLKLAVADDVTENGFRARTPNGISLSNALPDPNQRPSVGVSRERHTAAVEVKPELNMPMLPVYAEPVSTKRINSGWLYDTTRQMLYSPSERSGGMNYEFDYVKTSYSPQELDKAPEPRPDDAVRLQFTGVPHVDSVSELVTRLTARATTPYERVRAIFDYFSYENGFRYELATQPGTSQDKIVNFLKNKVGFCEQYAAAMAWLVRVAGLPSRVAFGFTRGSDISSANGQFTSSMTNRNLHAWTEVYFENFGWVPFDATPSVPGSTSPPWATHDGGPSTGPSASPGVGGGGGESPDIDKQRNLPGDRDPGSESAVSPAGAAWPWYLLGSVALVVLLLSIPLVRRKFVRRRRTRYASPATVDVSAAPAVAAVADAGVLRARHIAHEAWDELIDTLMDFGVPADPAETPRSISRRLVVEQEFASDAADGATQLGMAEERARYARTPLDPAPLGPSLRSVRQALKIGADRRTRIMAVLMPPSVTARWRLATLDFTSRTVRRLGDLRVRLSKFSPRRLLASR